MLALVFPWDMKFIIMGCVEQYRRTPLNLHQQRSSELSEADSDRVCEARQSPATLPQTSNRKTAGLQSQPPPCRRPQRRTNNHRTDKSMVRKEKTTFPRWLQSVWIPGVKTVWYVLLFIHVCSPPSGFRSPSHLEKKKKKIHINPNSSRPQISRRAAGGCDNNTVKYKW